MEGSPKRAHSPKVSPLRLHLFVPIRDVRKLIWRHLEYVDRELVRCAQNSAHSPKLRYSEVHKIVRTMPHLSPWAIRGCCWGKAAIRILMICAMESGHYSTLNEIAAHTSISPDDAGYVIAIKLMKLGLLQPLCTLLRDTHVCCTPPEQCGECAGFWCDILEEAPNTSVRSHFMQFLFSKRQ
jgi:hypothetical protein